MPNATHLRCRTIEVDNGFLPAPATKLIITQHLKTAQDDPFWAWIIVAAFYDSDNNVVWSTELFIGQFDINAESEDEGSDQESVNTGSEVGQGDTESEIGSGECFHGILATNRPSESQPDYYKNIACACSDASFLDLYISDRESPRDEYNIPITRRLQQVPQVHRTFPGWYESAPLTGPPETWDPTRQGPVPGFWQASFDPHNRRWVNTWQSLC